MIDYKNIIPKSIYIVDNPMYFTWQLYFEDKVSEYEMQSYKSLNEIEFNRHLFPVSQNKIEYYSLKYYIDLNENNPLETINAVSKLYFLQ